MTPFRWPCPLCAVLVLLPGLVAAVPPASPPAAGRPGPPVPVLPAPGVPVFRTPQLQAWPAGAGPTVPAGVAVERLATGLDNPRSLLLLPNGDVLVAESRTESMGGFTPEAIAALSRQGVFGPSPNRILLLRRQAGGVARHVFLTGLRQPFGMALVGGQLYVANTDSLARYPYRPGATRLAAPPVTVLPLPAGPDNNHWTRNLLASADGRRLFIAVGAGTNANEAGTEPPDRAAIWEVRPDGSGRRLFATGLRNPVGLAFEPVSGALWATVNERDGLGEDVPPDYLTEVVEGAFYGWPWVYFGTYPDPVQQQRDPAGVAAARQRARVPDVALGGHSVPLGLVFYRGTGAAALPAAYRGGAFVARRGGGGRARLLGFDVVFVPFRGGRPAGPPRPFLTGFIADPVQGIVHGRPVGLLELEDGSLLVSDDAGNVIWRVSGATSAGTSAP